MNTLQAAGRGQRLRIGIFGLPNAGKSALMNALLGEDLVLVSPYAGTTTDPVEKNMEIPGLGPVTFIDTAGLETEGDLGLARAAKSRAQIASIDLALVAFDAERWSELLPLWQELKERGTDRLALLTKADQEGVQAFDEKELEEALGGDIYRVSAFEQNSVDNLQALIVKRLADQEEGWITGDLVRSGDHVLLIMPQDSQAPKGRLIGPQASVIRELLDRSCRVTCIGIENILESLEDWKQLPSLAICDSRVFEEVDESLPNSIPLTSFSVLLACQKGDGKKFKEGAQTINRLKSGDRILIAEACSHPPGEEDIGTVKIPAALRNRVKNLEFEFTRGNEWPTDLSRYALIIHCGACMFNRRHVLSRLHLAEEAGVPMTNYGMALAYLQGILDRVVLPTS